MSAEVRRISATRPNTATGRRRNVRPTGCGARTTCAARPIRLRDATHQITAPERSRVRTTSRTPAPNVERPRAFATPPKSAQVRANGVLGMAPIIRRGRSAEPREIPCATSARRALVRAHIAQVTSGSAVPAKWRAMAHRALAGELVPPSMRSNAPVNAPPGPALSARVDACRTTDVYGVGVTSSACA
jgi:hypothetical protein